MPVPFPLRITHWIFAHLLWDTSGPARIGFWQVLRKTRRLIAAFVLSAWLTWREWVQHHPPEIAIIAVIHFVFVLALIALLVLGGQRLSRSGKKSPGL